MNLLSLLCLINRLRTVILYYQPMLLNLVLITPCIVLYIQINVFVIFLISYFNCSSLPKKRPILSNLFKFFNIPFNFPSILKTNYEPLINLVIIYILEPDITYTCIHFCLILSDLS